MNTIQDLRDACQEAGKVTDKDWESAESKFRLLAGCFCPADSDHFSLEMEAFRTMMTAHTKGQFEEVSYW